MRSSNDNHTVRSNKSNVVPFSPLSEKSIIDEFEESRLKGLLEVVDKLRANIINGKMDDVVIIARNLENNLFFTEVSIRQSTYKSPEIGSVAAILHMVSITCNDMLAIAPYSDLDGNIHTPPRDMLEEGIDPA